MRHRLLLLTLVLCLFGPVAFSQGLDTTAKKDDWEEINFEFDSHILTDGYPSLLRLAELLNQNPEYKVKLEGHTDFIGSNAYNETLSQRRAEMVRDFLVKYGARATQITIEPKGKTAPKVPNQTDEGRFMNRRVVMVVTDGQGRIVSDGGVREAIQGMEKVVQKDCCDELLSKLDKLDEIIDLLKGLKDENDQLKRDVADLKQAQEGLKGDVDHLAAAPPAPTKEEVAQVVKEALPKPAKRFQTLGLNVGPDTDDGNIAYSGKGRFFQPFAKHHAVQIEGEFMHFFGRNEGQFDIGLVNRWGHFQAGGFSSFKYVKFDEFQQAGALGQGSMTLDYVFNRGRVGFFGTKRFLDGAVVNTALLNRNLIEETYLRVVDQVGFSTAVAAWGDSWFEGNFGAMFRSAGDNRPGGTIRYIHPINDKVAFTVEAGLNETLISSNNTGRVVVGLQFGGWLSPKNYNVDEDDRPVPADIPRVRYEVLKRQVRTGNDSPVAEAGPDRLGIDAGSVTLDGSASFDPDGDPITFQWEQIGGPPVELTGANTAQASFTTEEGQNYQFRLTVRDDQGGVGTDRVTVATTKSEIIIKRFTVSPTEVDAGQPVSVLWEVQNADQVEITGLGKVDNSGTSQVTVNETTTFTLTARNSKREISESVTVTVRTNAPRIVRFSATPLTIQAGQTAVLAWETENATQVNIDQIGSVGTSGSATVAPTETTNYTITASNAFGSTSQTLTVTVVGPAAPRILSFVATPQEILPGQQSALVWEVENADEVTISGIGPVDLAGTTSVSPEETTTYTLTARNATGEVTATAIVTVGGQVRILNFTSDKTVVANPRDPAVLTWQTENAVRVVITPDIGEVQPNGSITVNPVAITTYNLIAYGRNTEASAVLIIKIENANRSPIAVAEGPVAILVPMGTETGTGTLDGSKSYDPDKDPITYEWRVIGTRSAVIKNPTAVKPTVEFTGGFGQYTFELMVTDDKGAMGRDTVTFPWVDP